MITGEKETPPKANPDPDNNLSRGAPQDREDRVRERAHQSREQEGRPDGRARTYGDRAPQDLDREDAEIQRQGTADKKAGVKQEKPVKDGDGPTKA